MCTEVWIVGYLDGLDFNVYDIMLEWYLQYDIALFSHLFNSHATSATYPTWYILNDYDIVGIDPGANH